MPFVVRSLALLLVLAGVAAAQVAPPWIAEARAGGSGVQGGAVLPSTAAPPGPVRGIAEWEPARGVLSLWRNAELMGELQDGSTVYVPVKDAAEQADWVQWLGAQGIPTTHFVFVPIPAESLYTRDWGPGFVWDGNGDLAISKWWEGYSAVDDAFSEAFANLYGLPYYDSGLNHAGGDYLPNGYGEAFSCNWVYMKNPGLTEADLAAIREQYFGIDRYHVVSPYYPLHIDTWAKACGPETLIVVEYPESEAYWHAAANVTARHFESLESPWGRPYRVLRMPMFQVGGGPFGDEHRPYMNSLVTNGKLLYSVDGVPEDLQAQAVYEQAFPGYEVIGIDAQGTYHYDSLHCRTRNFAAADSVRVYPYPPGDTEDSLGGYTVTAEVLPQPGALLLPGHPALRWTETGGAPFQSMAMTPTGKPGFYSALLPARPQGTELSFWVEATDDGGASGRYPIVAPKGLMTMRVRADIEAPVLSRSSLVRCAHAAQGAAELRLLAVDDMATPEVRLELAVNGVPQPDRVLAREDGSYWYAGSLAGGLSAGDVVTYQVVARDGSAAGHSTRLPELGQIYCPVVASTQVAVVDLAPRACTAPFLLDTLGDLGVAYTHYTQWPADWSAHGVWLVCLGMFPQNHVLSTAEANDLVGALQAGQSVWLEGGDTWCFDAAKDLLKPWFGVRERSRGPGIQDLAGKSGTPADGMSLVYGEACVFANSIQPTGTGQALLVNNPGPNERIRAVLNDTGSYRSIASSFLLGGAEDGAWPSTRKELLLRALEFLGVGGIELTVDGVARPGETVTLRLDGQGGDSYLLFASPAEFHAALFGLGTLRLDPATLLSLGGGVVPPAGTVELPLPVPPGTGHLGRQVHFQALVGPQLAPGQAALSNRDILTIGG